MEKVKEETTQVVNPEVEADEDTMSGKYLTFPLGNEEYGLAIQYVTEIVGIQKITEVPDMPDFIKGVINLRGKVIPVMDVRIRFHFPAKDYNDQTCIIVTNIDDTPVGLVVDTVSEVIDIPADQIDLPPAVKSDEGSRYIQGLSKAGDDVKILLNVRELLNWEGLKELAERA